jgi:hypothetical protein
MRRLKFLQNRRLGKKDTRNFFKFTLRDFSKFSQSVIQLFGNEPIEEYVEKYAKFSAEACARNSLGLSNSYKNLANNIAEGGKVKHLSGRKFAVKLNGEEVYSGERIDLLSPITALQDIIGMNENTSLLSKFAVDAVAFSGDIREKGIDGGIINAHSFYKKWKDILINKTLPTYYKNCLKKIYNDIDTYKENYKNFLTNPDIKDHMIPFTSLMCRNAILTGDIEKFDEIFEDFMEELVSFVEKFEYMQRVYGPKLLYLEQNPINVDDTIRSEPAEIINRVDGARSEMELVTHIGTEEGGVDVSRSRSISPERNDGVWTVNLEDSRKRERNGDEQEREAEEQSSTKRQKLEKAGLDPDLGTLERLRDSRSSSSGRG